ncbi:MAG: VCBS repeat-containing protein [Candidatus Thermoplasmatota archaeon]|nr:VCBS repeat-containing protein [Candidatus Thermoplasmatota archaeon]
MDLIVGSESGTIHYYENVGEEDSPEWKEKSHMFPIWQEFDWIDDDPEGVWIGTNSSVSLAEVEGEVYLYLGNEEGEVYRFKNTVLEENHASWENLGPISNLDVGSYASPTVCDIDSDGRRDLILGSEDGDVRYINNHGTPSRPEYPVMDHDADDLPLGKLSWGPSYYPEVERFTTLNLTSEYVDHYADMILDTEEKYLDEVVYQIANDKINQLRSMKDNDVSHLYLKNAETIYEMAENLTYADIVEMDGYSTLEYNTDEGTEIVPREKYYKYTLMFNRYTLSPEDWPDRTEGNFYRSYLPYDDTYNVTLFEKVRNASTAHEAAYNISYWLQEDIGAWWHTGPKPSGWYNIYHQLTNESAGIWCGEFAIIWQVASRSVLIPSLNIVALGEDHQFNNFWYNGTWHHVDSSTGIDEFDADRGLAYWYKEGYSHPMKWAENGRYDPVERAPLAYTPEDEEARVEVKVRDAEGNPVDGARVELWSHAVTEAYGLPLPTGITMTDSHGEAAFDPVGFNTIGHFEENNFSVVATSRIGSQRTEVVITENRTYTLEITLDSTLPGLQEATKSEEVDSPDYKTDVDVEVDSGYQDAPCWLVGMHETTWQYEEGMAIDAYVLTEDQYQDYRLGRDFSALAMLEDVDSGSLSEVLFNDDVYLVLSNRDSLTTTKTIELTQEVNSANGIASTSEDIETTEEIPLSADSDSISEEVKIRPGEDYAVHFDEESGELITEPVKNSSEYLNGNASDAIDRAPEWLEDKLTTSFTKLMKQEIEVGSHSNPTMGDLDGDGLVDMLVGNGEGEIYRYTNVGTETAPIWREDGMILEIDVEGPANPTLGDLTGNGELDLVVGTGDGTLQFFTKIGTEWEQVDRFVEGIEVENNSAPFLFDLRGNGLLDLIVGSESGTIHYYENVGEEDSPEWKEKSHMFPIWQEFDWIDDDPEGVWIGTNSSVSLAEVEGEVYLYLGNEEGEVYRFKNTVLEENHASWENLGPISNLDVGSYASPTVCDIDSDGRRDLILGSEDGDVRYINNHGTPSRPEYPVMDHDADDLPLGKLSWGPSYYPEVERFTTLNLTSEYVDHYADMILDTEEKYLDEVVYQIANDKINQLRSMKDNDVSHLYLKNAETIYEMAENLTYADIVEMDGYSTLEYNTDEGTEIVPREKYYKYTLMFNRYTLSPEDWPDRTEGNFYRSYLPYDDTYNVTLFEKVRNASTAHEAAYNISYWLQEDIGAWWHTGPKPSGWYNIYHQLTNESAGIWCGEFAIIWQVASRSVLIPSLNIVALGEDHQFNNFWYNGTWHHVDSSTGIDEFDADRGLAYWYKEGYSHPMKWAENGRYDPVERAPLAYTPEDEEARVEVKVRDAEGNPVDGARVELWSHAVTEAYGLPLPTGITMTDSHGEAAFDPVGFNTIGHFEENNFSVVATSRIGSQRTEVVITENRTYTLEITLDSTLPGLQEATKSEEVDSPDYKTDVDVEVDSGYQDAPCWLVGMHETTWQYEEGMAIDAYVLTEDQYQDYRLGRDFSALAMLEDVDSGSLSEVLFNDDVYLVLSNRDSLTTTKTIDLTMSIEEEPLEVDSVVISPDEDQTVTAGDTIDFSAEAYDEYGNLITDVETEFTWQNTNDTGVFDETTAGDYDVTAEYGGVTSSITTVTVEPAEVDYVEIDPAEDQTITAGETIDFEAEAYDEYGNLITDVDTDFTWQNTDDEGLFTETTAGDYDVTATYEGVTSESTIVTVELLEEYELTINIDGEGSVDVNPDQDVYEEGTDVTLTAVPDEDWEFVEWTGDYTGTEEEITITMDEDKEITAVFEELEPAYFEVEIIDYDENVTVGDNVTVELTVENTGELEGTQDIVLTVDDTEVDSREVTLAGGDTESVEFTWETEEAGDYDLEVASEDTSDSVTVTVGEVDEEEEDGLVPGIPGFTSILLLVASVIAVAIYHKKKQLKMKQTKS